MPPELDEVLDEIESANGELGTLAAAVDRKSLDGLPELVAAAAGTEWRGALIAAVMIGYNDGE
jgi:hypothetical protein